METDLKEAFISELKKAGYQAENDHGVPVVLVGSPSELRPVSKKIDKIAKKVGYTASKGVTVKAGAAVGVTGDDSPEEEFVEISEIPGDDAAAAPAEAADEPFAAEAAPLGDAEEGGTAFASDEGGQMSFL